MYPPSNPVFGVRMQAAGSVATEHACSRQHDDSARLRQPRLRARSDRASCAGAVDMLTSLYPIPNCGPPACISPASVHAFVVHHAPPGQLADVAVSHHHSRPSHGPARSNPASVHAVVVGAGPVGLLTSLYLARRGYRVDVYERCPPPAVVGAAAALRGHNYPMVLSARALLAFRELRLATRYNVPPGAVAHLGTWDVVAGQLEAAAPADPNQRTVVADRQGLVQELDREARRLYPGKVRRAEARRDRGGLGLGWRWGLGRICGWRGEVRRGEAWRGRGWGLAGKAGGLSHGCCCRTVELLLLLWRAWLVLLSCGWCCCHVGGVVVMWAVLLSCGRCCCHVGGVVVMWAVLLSCGRCCCHVGGCPRTSVVAVLFWSCLCA
eukprot:366254-Chlamydomonas_euryale.AAC.2